MHPLARHPPTCSCQSSSDRPASQPRLLIPALPAASFMHALTVLARLLVGPPATARAWWWASGSAWRRSAPSTPSATTR